MAVFDLVNILHEEKVTRSQRISWQGLLSQLIFTHHLPVIPPHWFQNPNSYAHMALHGHVLAGESSFAALMRSSCSCSSLWSFDSSSLPPVDNVCTPTQRLSDSAIEQEVSLTKPISNFLLIFVQSDISRALLFWQILNDTKHKSLGEQNDAMPTPTHQSNLDAGLADMSSVLTMARAIKK